MCGGASDEQKDTFAAQSAFYKEMTAENKQVFARNQDILAKLTASLQPILDAGINQMGFSPEERAALNTQAVEGTARNYSKAAAALGEQQGAEGGGTVFIPSGAKMQEQAALASSAAGSESDIQSNILAADYATGRSNYLAAASGLGGVAAGYDPTGYANAATGAGNAAASTANQISQANNSWMQLVSAGLGAAGTAAAGYLGKGD